MTYPLSSITGLSAFAISKLKAAGIKTTDKLVDAAATVAKRKALAKKAGFTEQQILEWANLANCLRVDGMGKINAELLRTAGVTTVRELALRNPERLLQRMREINDKRKLLKNGPSEKTVRRLIENARRIDPKIKY